MYTSQSTLIPSRDLMMRFEPDLDGGTLFLFHIATNRMFTADAEAHALLELLDGQRTLGQVCDRFRAWYPALEPDAIAGKVAHLTSQLLALDCLEEP